MKILTRITICIIAVEFNGFASDMHNNCDVQYSCDLESRTLKSFQNGTPEYIDRQNYLKKYAKWKYDCRCVGIDYEVGMYCWEMCQSPFGDPPTLEYPPKPELPQWMIENDSDQKFLMESIKKSEINGSNEFKMKNEYLQKFEEWANQCTNLFTNTIEEYEKQYSEAAWNNVSGSGGHKFNPEYPNFPDEPNRPWWIKPKVW